MSEKEPGTAVPAVLGVVQPLRPANRVELGQALSTGPRGSGTGAAAVSVEDDEAVAERVERLLLQTLNVRVDGRSQNLVDAGVLDSLGLVELLFAIEQEFRVEVPLNGIEIADFRTVESIAAFVHRVRLQQATAA